MYTKSQVIHNSWINSRVISIQIKEMNRTGFTYMTPEQLDHFYGPVGNCFFFSNKNFPFKNSPFNNSEALNRFKSMDTDTMNYHMEQDIHKMAEHPEFLQEIMSFQQSLGPNKRNSSEHQIGFPRRSKRTTFQVLSPTTLSGIFGVEENSHKFENRFKFLLITLKFKHLDYCDQLILNSITSNIFSYHVRNFVYF